jgi:hypothetical protein
MNTTGEAGSVQTSSILLFFIIISKNFFFVNFICLKKDRILPRSQALLQKKAKAIATLARQ